MRECWNWQTGTFEGRVFMTYEFKSRLAHQGKIPETAWIVVSGIFLFPAYTSGKKLRRCRGENPFRKYME